MESPARSPLCTVPPSSSTSCGCPASGPSSGMTVTVLHAPPESPSQPSCTDSMVAVR